MAKTRLFAKLRRIAASTLAERPRVVRGSDGGRFHLTRRQLTWGVAQLAAAQALEACSSDSSDGGAGGPRVAVVGAGVAGLHCAYRLQQAGVNVSVFEASNRVGGRMFTARDKAYDGQVFELGGELIDSNHSTLFALAKEFDIQLDDRLADPDIQADVWFVGGAEVPESTIVEQFTAVAPAMADAVAAADDENDDTAFNELNETPLSDWLAQNVPTDQYPELFAILESAYRGEFGLEISEQSALNLLYLIGSDAPDPFRIFGESDERYHAHTGSESFPSALADELKEGVVSLDSRLVALSGGDGAAFTLELASKDGTKRQVEADYVVLALPFSVLRKVSLKVPLSDLKRQIIQELGYGTNAKVMGQFDSRVWREAHAKSGTVTSDLPLQQAWDTSIGQPGKRGILTNFLGGKAGADVGDPDPEAYYTGLLADFERIFPGVSDTYLSGSARRMHWPSYPYTLGSYTCYLPGQWSFWGHEGEREGNLLFCGEHTSVDFQGWMEGGAETGAFAAAEVLKDLGLKPSRELSAILKEKGRA